MASCFDQENVPHREGARAALGLGAPPGHIPESSGKANGPRAGSLQGAGRKLECHFHQGNREETGLDLPEEAW